MDDERLRVAVLLGSVRSDRMGLRAARFAVARLAARGYAPTLVDPLALQLPLLDRMYEEHPAGDGPAPLDRLATLYRAADGFVIVSGEYNDGTLPALKNLLDHFLEEYFWRPSAILCYSAGGFGGVRAALQLRMTLSEFGMPSIPSLLPVPRIASALAEDGAPLPEAAAALERQRGRFLDEFAWYMRAFRRERAAGVPY